LSLIREIPPTAGWPLTIKSLIPPFFKKYPEGLLEEDFKRYLGAPFVLVTCSGTAAFYLILESMKKLSGRKTVIIPAFVCPLIPLAIKRAGLKIKLCDINQNNFDFDMDKLQKICAEDKDILAILAVHLGGIPLDLSTIKEIAGKNKIFIIEDCAQSLGSEYRNKKTGSFGEFAFFSLCRGKGLTIYEGGLAITNLPEYAQLLNDTYKKIMRRDNLSEWLKIAELFGYSIFYRPELFWFAFRAPQIFWQMRNNPVRAMGEYFDANFPLDEVSAFRKSLGHTYFHRISEKVDKQRKKVDIYLNGLSGLPGIKPILEPTRTRASYPYLALIFDNAQKRNSALNIFKDSGLGVSQVYLHAITDYAYLRDCIPDENCANSRALAQNSITLSTSSFLRKPELENIVEKLKKI